MKIAIIPARGGSKRIPKKNIRKFHGKPIIEYSIEKAKSSGLFDQIIVSTDNDEIANISRHIGAVVPFVRPKHLSDDYTGTDSVLAHAVSWLYENSWNIEMVCCIYATAPLMQVTDIVSAHNKMSTNEWDFVFSAAEYANPQRTFTLGNNDEIKMFFPDAYSERSQDLKSAYMDAGQFYWGKPKAWLESKTIYSSQSTVIVIPSNRVVDIDTEQDWDLAEKAFSTVVR